MKALPGTERTLGRTSSGGPSTRHRSRTWWIVAHWVARKVTACELTTYRGLIDYLPHLAVKIPKLQSTPVRICFNTFRAQRGCRSLDQMLAKVPDRFLNSLAEVIIGFQDGRIASEGDVRKMYNSVCRHLHAVLPVERLHRHDHQEVGVLWGRPGLNGGR